MHIVSFFAFVFGALLGLTMAVLHLRGIASPRSLGLAHGVFVIAGLIFLVTGLLQNDAPDDRGWGIAALFGLAALGGLYLFTRQAKGQSWPTLVVLAHGGLALTTLVLLGVWAFGQPPV